MNEVQYYNLMEIRILEKGGYVVSGIFGSGGLREMAAFSHLEDALNFIKRILVSSS